jgi:hypothetical protein
MTGEPHRQHERGDGHHILGRAKIRRCRVAKIVLVARSRRDSLWYPTATLFGQIADGDRGNAVTRIFDQLKIELAARA